jgi:hypothetical protein
MKIIGIKEETKDTMVLSTNGVVQVPVSYIIQAYDLDSPQMLHAYEQNPDLFIVEGE